MDYRPQVTAAFDHLEHETLAQLLPVDILTMWWHPPLSVPSSRDLIPHLLQRLVEGQVRRKVIDSVQCFEHEQAIRRDRIRSVDGRAAAPTFARSLHTDLQSWRQAQFAAIPSDDAADEVAEKRGRA